VTEGVRRKAEDTATGCRDRATKDRQLAADEPNALMRDRLESSAAAWSARASLLERLEGGQRNHLP
jgi:hypothetical protein